MLYDVVILPDGQTLQYLSRFGQNLIILAQPQEIDEYPIVCIDDGEEELVNEEIVKC